MSVSYTCPNPDCGVTLKTPNRVAAGKSVKCPKCGSPFVPEPARSRPREPARSSWPTSRRSPPRAREAVRGRRRGVGRVDQEGLRRHRRRRRRRSRRRRRTSRSSPRSRTSSRRAPAARPWRCWSCRATCSRSRGWSPHRGGSVAVRRRHVAAGVQRRPARRGGTGRGASSTMLLGVLVLRVGRDGVLRGQPDAGTRVVPVGDGRGDHGHRPAAGRHLRASSCSRTRR